jgi:hypothetical protein
MNESTIQLIVKENSDRYDRDSAFLLSGCHSHKGFD